MKCFKKSEKCFKYIHRCSLLQGSLIVNKNPQNTGWENDVFEWNPPPKPNIWTNSMRNKCYLNAFIISAMIISVHHAIEHENSLKISLVSSISYIPNSISYHPHYHPSPSHNVCDTYTLHDDVFQISNIHDGMYIDFPNISIWIYLLVRSSKFGYVALSPLAFAVESATSTFHPTSSSSSCSLARSSKPNLSLYSRFAA